MSEQLKPCPFCGSDYVGIVREHSQSWQGTCHKCGATSEWDIAETEAAAAWNRRASGWLPIKTVPQTDQEVLIWIQFPNGRGNFGMGFYDQIERRWNVYDTNEQPTHWQPLPEPPKEKE